MHRKQPDLSSREERMSHIEMWLRRYKTQQLVNALECAAAKQRAAAARRGSHMCSRLGEHIGYHRSERPVDSDEVCTGCGKKLGFSRLLHVDASERWENGAVYIEGSGQLCSDCARRIYPLPEVRFDMGSG
jgi:hypothetical protein